MNFVVEISGALVAPGERDVRVDVYASADLEYSSISVPLDFDERYLRVARAEDRFVQGVVLVDNNDTIPGAGPEEGHVVLFSGLGVNSKRLAMEGERLHVGTLYLDVLESAVEIETTDLRVATVTDWRGVRYSPWIGVSHRSGTGVNDPPVRTEAEPIAVSSGILRLARAAASFLRGDADQNGTLSVGDAILTLDHLFLGTQLLWCEDAADANDDGILNIVDPVALLRYLFLSGPELPPPSGVAGEDPTADALDCLGAL